MRIKGIFLSILLGVIALLSAQYIPMLNAIVVALLLGILIANVFTVEQQWNTGISFTSKYFLEIAIIFLGFGISFQDIGNLGWQVVAILVISIVIVLVSTIYLAKLFSCRASTGYLVGFGTAICGSSAIAALAPKIAEDKNQAGIAIAVVNLLGLVGMLLFPIFLDENIAADTSALLIGASLHGVSNVAGAGYAINETVGDLAITIKLGRVALLAPAMIFFNFMLNKNASFKENIKLPYYIIGFILASTIVTFFSLPQDLIAVFRGIGKVLLTISMAAIGLNIHFSQMYRDGRIALGFGAVIFAILLIVIGLLSYFLSF
jgi:uncharacterized integral membrane protein (TIGR00698 family)